MVAEPGELPRGMDLVMARFDAMQSRMKGIEDALQNRLDSIQMGIEVALQKISGCVEEVASG